MRGGGTRPSTMLSHSARSAGERSGLCGSTRLAVHMVSAATAACGGTYEGGDVVVCDRALVHRERWDGRSEGGGEQLVDLLGGGGSAVPVQRSGRNSCPRSSV